jgi:hypothetical protein
MSSVIADSSKSLHNNFSIKSLFTPLSIAYSPQAIAFSNSQSDSTPASIAVFGFYLQDGNKPFAFGFHSLPLAHHQFHFLRS